tara:strand:- start:497 stop:1006 length:510 start_codon:yes stop_codon:yes gene_type:complete
MNDKKKKLIITAVIGLFTITGAIAYWQYQKLKKFVLKFKSIKFNKISTDSLNFDLFLDFTNTSNVQFILTNQQYMVYVNDIFVAKVQNTISNKVKAKSTSTIGVNVNLVPKDIAQKVGSGALDILMDKSKIKIKIDSEITAKLGVFSGKVKSTYEDTLKNMLTPKPVSV